MLFRDELPEILPPSENGVFQSTFTREGAKPALQELLSDILGRPLKNVTIRNAEPPLADIDAKREVFDINCVAEDDKSQLDIEMQASPMDGDTRASEHRNIRNRSIFNLCDLHANQPGRGVRYGDLFNSYQITICNFNVFDWDNELVEMFTYRNERGRQLSDITTAIFIDLTKAAAIAKKAIEDMTSIEQWTVFLAKAGDPNYRAVINKIIGNKEGIQVAYEMLTSISTDENERARFHSRKMWQMDRDHEMAVARIEGEERANAKWQSVVAEQAKRAEEQAKRIAELEARLADK
jgi:predicted transposase/invertase (TIGR01784 family)